MEDIVYAGCGAVGSRMALEAGRSDLSYRLIDDDTVDRNNVRTGSTIYWGQHIGGLKVNALGEMLYRRWGCLVAVDNQTLTERRVIDHYQLFRGARVIVDGFDNVHARRLLCDLQDLPAYGQPGGIPLVLHVGVSAHGTGIVAWGDQYDLPTLSIPRGENPVCTHALGRGIITFTASVAALILADYLETGATRSVLVTKSLGIISVTDF